MRIAFIIPKFGVGGAERVGSLLCNAWAAAGHRVTAITFEAQGAEPAFALDPRVAVCQTDVLNTSDKTLLRMATNVRRLSRLRDTLKKLSPDVIVSFTTEANVVALWAAAGLDIPVVISERNQPERPGLGQWREMVRRLSYPLAAGIVVQTEAIASWARQRFGVPIEVLPNPIRLSVPSKTPSSSGETKRIIAVGRLVRQKGFDVLIESFGKIADRHPDWMVLIYGEGAERKALEAQIRNTPCAERIRLMGLADNIDRAYADADLFVSSSRYEGYPNALLEALAAGCPVVAANCPGATSEILRCGRHGLLIEPESVDALKAGLDRMMSDEELRTTFAAHAREAVSELDASVVGQRWLDLLSSLP